TLRMAGALDNKQILVKIFIGIFVGLIGISMLLYLVPQGPGTGADADASDVVAKVGNQTVSLADVRQQLSDIQRRNHVPKALEAVSAWYTLIQLAFTNEFEFDAQRPAIKVTTEEIANRVNQFLPAAFNGDTPVGMDQYANQVQQRFQMSVPMFETLVRQGL